MSAQNTPKQSLNLSKLAPAHGSRSVRKRRGLGESSGLGKTSGKGHKGHTSRSGFHHTRGFEGGQMPLHRRLPKRGFTSRKRVAGDNVFAIVSIAKLATLNSAAPITIDLLLKSGLVRRNADKIKILGSEGAIGKIVVEAHAVSAAARAAIEAAGGEVRLIEIA